jgi:hypothetical protein
VGGGVAGVFIGVAQTAFQFGPQTWAVAQDALDAPALFRNRGAPAPALEPGLVLPFEQVEQQDLQPVGELAAFATAHALAQGQRWLGFGAIVLFVLLAFAVAPPIETWLRSFFRPALPPMGEKPQPRRGLILLFSNEQTALCAIDHHGDKLEYVLCVVSEFMEERFNKFRGTRYIVSLQW